MTPNMAFNKRPEPRNISGVPADVNLFDKFRSGLFTNDDKPRFDKRFEAYCSWQHASLLQIKGVGSLKGGANQKRAKTDIDMGTELRKLLQPQLTTTDVLAELSEQDHVLIDRQQALPRRSISLPPTTRQAEGLLGSEGTAMARQTPVPSPGPGPTKKLQHNKSHNFYATLRSQSSDSLGTESEKSEDLYVGVIIPVSDGTRLSMDPRLRWWPAI